jgi:hypothetical protein
MNLDHWPDGERAHFEYHCWENPASSDAEAWYRSHQIVTVLGEARSDASGDTLLERAENGQPKAYRVRFDDGLEWTAFEDELLTDPSGFERPDPPRR